MDCGKGTYIRSIVRDVGEALGCGGLVEVLVRTRIGPFSQGDAIDPTGLAIDAILDHLRPTETALGDLPRLKLSSGQFSAIGMGKALAVHEVEGAEGLEGEAGLLGPDGMLVAIADVGGPLHAIRPRRVLASQFGGISRTGERVRPNLE